MGFGFVRETPNIFDYAYDNDSDNDPLNRSDKTAEDEDGDAVHPMGMPPPESQGL